MRLVILRSIGNFLVLFSLYGVGATFGPALYYEAQFRIIQARGMHFAVNSTAQFTPVARSVSDTSGPGFEQLLAGEKEQVLTPKDTEFSILIPKIAASAKIYPNVDPANETEYLAVLQKGIAHAKGSVFPGMQGNIYLFAHSTDNWWHVGRYNAIFYLLKDLAVNDDITVFFENRRYDYVVSKKIISDPGDVTLLTQEQQHDEQLVLQTCWPPGTTWKRLYIIAQPARTVRK